MLVRSSFDLPMQALPDGPVLSARSDEASMPPARPGHFGGLIVVLAAIALCLPFMQSIWLLADEGIWVHAGLRMVEGKILYSDFFELHPPLGFLIVYGWMSAFGTSLLAARLLVVTVIAITAWITHACCGMMTRRRGLPIFLTMAWLVSSQGTWTQVNHHSLTSMFSMICLWAMLTAEGKPGRRSLAGAAASAATLVTTHRGSMVVLAGLVSLMPGRSARAVLIYAGSGMALFVAILSVLWWQGSLAEAYADVVLYPSRHYSNIQSVRFGAFSNLQMMLAVTAFPLAAGLLVVAIKRDGLALMRQQKWNIASLFALVGFLGCFPRPDAVHIVFCLPLVLPLLAALLDTLLPRGAPGPVLVVVATIVISLPLSVWLAQAAAVHSAPRMASRAGSVWIVPANGTAQLIARLNDLAPKDAVFFYPYDPVLPFLTGHPHPATLDLLVPQYTTPQQYRQTCHEVMTRAQWVVMDTAIAQPGFYHAVFPAMTTPSPPEKRDFENAVKRGFVLAGRYGEFELWRRAYQASSPCP